MGEHAHEQRATLRFLLLYALAWAGGSIAYIPLLTILLPVHVMAQVGAERAVPWLAYIAFVGAVAASLGHIGFGYLSDITKRRRPWIWAGLILSSALLLIVPWVTALPALIGLILLWQMALNMMLAPLAAMAGDRVPDAHKGLLGGLMAFAPGLGALSGALITIPGMAAQNARFGFVAMIVALCVLPVLLFGGANPARCDAQHPSPEPPHEPGFAWLRQGPLLRMWLARLAVQIGEATLFAFLYVWFRSVDSFMNDNRTASMLSAVLILSAPLALLAGGWADRRARPLSPLIVCAVIAAVGLAGMAAAQSLFAAVATYAIFGIASSIFLALHSAQTLRVLPRSDRRGRDLGFFNLTNTLPSLIMPWFALTMVPYFGFSGLFILMAALSVLTAVMLAPLTRRN